MILTKNMNMIMIESNVFFLYRFLAEEKIKHAFIDRELCVDLCVFKMFLKQIIL